MPRVVETGLGGWVCPIRRGHRGDEPTRPGPPRRVGELARAPMPAATVPGMLPHRDLTPGRHLVVASGRAEGRRQRVRTPDGVLRTWAMEGQWVWRGRRGGGANGQGPGPGRGPRGRRALRTRARPRLCREHRRLGAAEPELGAFAACWAPLLQPYGRLGRLAVITREAGDGALQHAPRSEAAGDGEVFGLPAKPRERRRDAPRLLPPVAARPRPAAQV